MTYPADESALDEVVRERLLPNYRCIMRAVQAQPQAPQDIGVGAWAFWRYFYVRIA